VFDQHAFYAGSALQEASGREEMLIEKAANPGAQGNW
jgi:hypothetical protein